MKFVFSLLVILTFAQSGFVQANQTIPALKYTGTLFNNNPKATPRICEFYVSGDILNYGSLVDGEALPAVKAEYMYYDESMPLGQRYYSITESQGSKVLVLSYLELNDSALSSGVIANPNSVTDLISKSQLELLKILVFKSGTSYEDYLKAMNIVLQDPSQIMNYDSILNSVDTLRLSMWHAGHYDTPRCVNVVLDSVQQIEEESHHDHDHEEDHHDHDH